MEYRRSVLIVEDEGIIALDLRNLFERAGYRVIGVASDAEHALLLAASDPPAVAIIDVKLATAIDGITLAIELDARYKARVVFVTGNPQIVVNEARHLTNGIFSKPYQNDDLLRAVADA
jgi:DNA-binding NarL/FixJ family response regulator